MNEATLKNLLIFLNKLADTGALKGTNDLMAFGETYQAVQKALTDATSKPVHDDPTARMHG